MWSGIGRDLRSGWARLRAQPGFTAVALVCLGLGSGANAALFGVLDAVLLRPLPFAEPARLVHLWSLYPGADGGPSEYFTTTENFLELRRAEALESLAGVLDLDFDLAAGGGRPERVRGARASVELFRITGTRPVLGRTFLDREGRAGQGGVVVISEALWKRRFGGDPSVLGEVVRVDGRQHEVVGVVPQSASFPRHAELWVPLVPDDMSAERRQRGLLRVVGRLAEGEALDTARAELDRVAAALRELHPDRNRGYGVRLESLSEALSGELRPRLVALSGAVLFLLAIACANVAGLLLVRMRRERRGLALRAALGAGRGRLVRQLLTESLLLGGLGAAVGLAVASLALPLLLALVPEGTPGLETAAVDGRVLGFGLLLALSSVALFGTLPALVGSRADPLDALRSGGRTAAGSAGGARLQHAFVVAQVAAAVVLMLGTVSTAGRLARLGRVEPGFDPDGLISFRLAAPPARYPAHAERVRFFRRVVEAAREQPGVEGAAAAHVLPIADVAYGFAYSLRDRPPAEPDAQDVSFLRVVTPGYFDTMRVPVLAGRGFTRRDGPDAPPVVVVSRALARRHWPGESALGRQLKHRRYDSAYPWMTVVGVVEDVRDGGLSEPVSPTVYLPLAQWDLSYTSIMSVAVRSDRPAAELFERLREAVGLLDPDAAVFRTRTMDEVLGDSLAAERFTAALLGIFAALGLVLSAAGVYGVMAQAAHERRRELAIRAALGGTGASLAGLVLRRAAALAGLGVLFGLAGAALLVHRLPSGAQVAALPAGPLAAVPAVMAGVALLAALLPALRAARADPATALRSD